MKIGSLTCTHLPHPGVLYICSHRSPSHAIWNKIQGVSKTEEHTTPIQKTWELNATEGAHLGFRAGIGVQVPPWLKTPSHPSATSATLHCLVEQILAQALRVWPLHRYDPELLSSPELLRSPKQSQAREEVSPLPVLLQGSPLQPPAPQCWCCLWKHGRTHRAAKQVSRRQRDLQARIAGLHCSSPVRHGALAGLHWHAGVAKAERQAT